MSTDKESHNKRESKEPPKVVRVVCTTAEGCGSAANTGDKVSSVVYADSALTPFHHGAFLTITTCSLLSTALSLVDLIRIPSLYLYAWAKGEKIPFTVENNAKFALSLLLVSMGVAAFLMPALAVGLSFAIAFIGVGANIIALAVQVNSIVNLRIDRAMNLSKIDKLRAEAPINEKAIAKLETENKAIAQKLKNISAMAVIDKVVGIVLGTVAIAGLVLTFSMPLVGLMIVALASIAQLTYVACRVTLPEIKKTVVKASDKRNGMFAHKKSPEAPNTSKEMPQHFSESLSSSDSMQAA